jgi:hypothetical protein
MRMALPLGLRELLLLVQGPQRIHVWLAAVCLTLSAVVAEAVALIVLSRDWSRSDPQLVFRTLASAILLSLITGLLSARRSWRAIRAGTIAIETRGTYRTPPVPVRPGEVACEEQRLALVTREAAVAVAALQTCLVRFGMVAAVGLLWEVHLALQSMAAAR